MTPARASRGGNHEAFDELAVGWALHALEPEDEALFARHLPDCARCARTVSETADVMGALAGELPAAEPSEDLRRRLRAAVEHTEQARRPALPPDQIAEPPEPVAGPRTAGRPSRPGQGARPLRPGPARPGAPLWRRRLPQALIGVGVALVVGLGAWNVVLATSRQQAEQQAAQQSQIVDALLTPGQATIAPVSNSGGHAVATVVARHGQIQIVSWGLPVNSEASTTYVVWGMRNSSPVALGTFDVVRSGMDLRSVGSSRTGLDAYSGYAISLEQGRKAPAAPTDVVANGQVTS